MCLRLRRGCFLCDVLGTRGAYSPVPAGKEEARGWMGAQSPDEAPGGEHSAKRETIGGFGGVLTCLGGARRIATAECLRTERNVHEENKHEGGRSFNARMTARRLRREIVGERSMRTYNTNTKERELLTTMPATRKLFDVRMRVLGNFQGAAVGSGVANVGLPVGGAVQLSRISTMTVEIVDPEPTLPKMPPVASV